MRFRSLSLISLLLTLTLLVGYGDPALSRTPAGSRIKTSTRTKRGVIVPIPVINPPAAPSTLAVTAFSSSRLDLTWLDNSTNELLFRIERSANGTTGWSEIATVSPNVTSYSNSSLSASTTYYYRVRAYNLSGDGSTAQYSAYTSVASAATQAAAAPQAPSSVPTSLTVTPGSDGSGLKMSLSWVAPTGTAVDHYIVERTPIGPDKRGFDMAGWKEIKRVKGATSYVDRAITGGTYYRYRIRGVYTGGTITNTSTATAGTTLATIHASVPGSPSALYVGAASDTSIFLHWAVADSNENSFRVERSPNGSTGWTTLGTAPYRCNWYWDDSCSASTAYFYRVYAVNEIGSSASAATGNATTLAAGQVRSPTGRNPKVYWTPEWQGWWEQAKADYDANPSAPATMAGEMYSFIKARADADPATTYADEGRFASIIFQITGDTTYAQKSYTCLRTQSAYDLFKSVRSHNDIRESYADLIQLIEWDWPGFTTSQRAEAVDAANYYAYWAISKDVIESGTVVNTDASATTTSFKSSITSHMDSFYRGGISVTFTSGANNGKNAAINGYTKATGTITLSTALTAAPANGDTFTIGYAGYNAGTSIYDSDQCTGAGLGALTWDIDGASFGSSLAGTLSGFVQQTTDKFPLGTYTGTSTPGITSCRDAVKAYIALANGGHWIESKEYNQGTQALVFTAGQQLCDVSHGNYYGADTVPLREDLGRVWVVDLTPDIPLTGTSYPWGDIDANARQMEIQAWPQNTMLLAGMNYGKPIAPYLQDLEYQIWFSGRSSAKAPFARGFFFFNPYGARTSWKTLSNTHYSPGMGVMIHKSNPSTSTSSFFAAMSNQATGVQHETDWLSDYTLWRKGEWPIYAPIGYGGHADRQNTMLVAGLSPQARTRGTVAQTFGSGNRWSYLKSSSFGYRYDWTFYAPNLPATAIQEFTSSIVYLPSTDESCDVVIPFYRVNAANPKLLSNYYKYFGFTTSQTVAQPGGGSDADYLVNRATAYKEFVFHTPTSTPTLGSGFTQWTTTGGQNVKIQHLLPADGVRSAAMDENTVLNVFSWIAGERKWQFRITPSTAWPTTSAPIFDTWLQPWSVWDSGGTAPSISLLQSSSGETAQGVFVSRTGQEDAAVLFGAGATESTLRSGYTFSYTGGALGCRMILADLDDTKTWAYTVNGGASTPLTVSSQGTTEFIVSGAGTKTIVLTGS